MSSTANPYAARDHARAQGGTKVEAMPTVPATSGAAPVGVPAVDLIWDETIAAGGYAAKRLNRGARLMLVDLHGDACVSMLVFNAERPIERLNVADTLKIQWNGYLGAGKFILSDMGKVMLSILEDDAGGHDAFCGASNAGTNAARYGEGDNWGPHPNARDRFKLGVAKFGLGVKDIHPCINWFKGVKVEDGGGLSLSAGPFAGDRQVTLRAEMDLILVFANCPHVLDARPAYSVTPVRAVAWRDAPTPEDDPIRTGTPEGLRAFLNTQEDFRR